ncbi:hypothetical protein HF086_015618 [Spodoptera exigua]|uniref:Reelin domain-containing protein n=1 Tax=Spodoptera exigua TaxID=7107 RepID=A0A922SKX7_SPOEX|nr:hypothetical protein HF086_015618 [Spodoptera exigua]
MLASYVVLAVSLVVAANAYSTGAPESVCGDMVPKHPVPPQSTPPPYKITTSTQTAKAGTPLEIVISGNGPANKIRGLLAQARAGDKPIGKFTLKPSDPFAQLLNCGEPGVSTKTFLLVKLSR